MPVQKLVFAIVVAAASILSLGAHDGNTSDLPTSTSMERRTLGTVPEGTRMVIVSRDRKCYAAVVEQNGKVRVVSNGRADAWYDVIPNQDLMFSPNSGSLAYRAVVGDEQFVVQDGREHRHYVGVGDLVFTGVGSNLYYGAVEQSSRRDNFIVIFNGKPLARFPGYRRGTLTTKPGSNDYSAIVSDEESEYLYFRSKLVHKGKILTNNFFDAFGNLHYFVWDEDVKHYSLHTDGRVERTFASSDLMLTLKYQSKDGGLHFAYYCQQVPTGNNNSIITLDGLVNLGSNISNVFYDGVKGKTYSEIDTIILSSQGDHYAYVGMNQAQSYVEIVDGLPKQRTAGDTYETVVYDGREMGEWRSIDSRSLNLSEDGKNIAFVVTEEMGKSVVINGELNEYWEGIEGLTFAPDSKTVAYCGRRGSKWYVVSRHRKSMPCDEILSSPGNGKLSLERNGELRYCARIGPHLVMVREKWK
jgi:hypothetical protein